MGGKPYLTLGRLAELPPEGLKTEWMRRFGAPTPALSSELLRLGSRRHPASRPAGATIDQLVAATGWLPHTTRAALTGLKKKGHVLTSEKREEQARVYRAMVS